MLKIGGDAEKPLSLNPPTPLGTVIIYSQTTPVMKQSGHKSPPTAPPPPTPPHPRSNLSLDSR